MEKTQVVEYKGFTRKNFVPVLVYDSEYPVVGPQDILPLLYSRPNVAVHYVSLDIAVWREFSLKNTGVPLCYVNRKLNIVACLSYELKWSLACSSLELLKVAGFIIADDKLYSIGEIMYGCAVLTRPYGHTSLLDVDLYNLSLRTGLTKSDNLILFNPKIVDLQGIFTEPAEVLSPHDFGLDLQLWDNRTKEPRIQAFLSMKSNAFFGGIEIRHVLFKGLYGSVGVSLITNHMNSKMVGFEVHVLEKDEIPMEKRDSMYFSNGYCVDLRNGSYLASGTNSVSIKYSPGFLRILDYVIHTDSSKKFIPICIDEYYAPVIINHGYVICPKCIGSIKRCEGCHDYGFLIPCKLGSESSDGYKIHFSSEKLEQYLSSYNRLHCKQHLLFTLDYYCNSL